MGLEGGCGWQPPQSGSVHDYCGAVSQKGVPMPTKPIRTWVVIADAARARVFETRGKGTGLTAVDGLALETELLPNRELVSDRPGRSFESVGGTRHAMEGSDPHREQKRQFARRIVNVVEARQATKS